MNEKFFTYKGYPLVRCDNKIYYGYMSDPYVIYIEILDSKDVNGEKMTSKVRVILMDTNEPNPLKACKKNSEFECGLYEALDTAGIWLEKGLAN